MKIKMIKEEIMPKKIFISYASEDVSFAKKLSNDLNKLNLETWLDKEQLLPGQRWDYEIKKAIKNCDYVLCVLSNNSVDKRGYVQVEFKMILKELEHFPETKTFFIPLKIDDCIIENEIISQFQFADFSRNYESGLTSLIKALKPENDIPIINCNDENTKSKASAKMSNNTIIKSTVENVVIQNANGTVSSEITGNKIVGGSNVKQSVSNK